MKKWLKSGLLTIFLLSCAASTALAGFDFESINKLSNPSINFPRVSATAN